MWLRRLSRRDTKISCETRYGIVKDVPKGCVKYYDGWRQENRETVENSPNIHNVSITTE